MEFPADTGPSMISDDNSCPYRPPFPASVPYSVGDLFSHIPSHVIATFVSTNLTRKDEPNVKVRSRSFSTGLDALK